MSTAETDLEQPASSNRRRLRVPATHSKKRERPCFSAAGMSVRVGVQTSRRRRLHRQIYFVSPHVRFCAACPRGGRARPHFAPNVNVLPSAVFPGNGEQLPSCAALAAALSAALLSPSDGCGLVQCYLACNALYRQTTVSPQPPLRPAGLLKRPRHRPTADAAARLVSKDATASREIWSRLTRLERWFWPQTTPQRAPWTHGSALGTL